MRSRFFHSRREILRAVNEMRDASTGVRDGAAIEYGELRARQDSTARMP